MTDQLAFRRALDMNDAAHQKTIRELGSMPDIVDHDERQEVFKEIQREARMWLNEVFKNHHWGETSQ